MTLDLEISPEENRLIEYSQEMVVKYNMMRHQNGGQDTLYSFLLSDSGNFYDGASYEPNIAQATVCGERCAMAAMVLHESYSAKIRHIVVADPVPDVQEQGTLALRHLPASHLVSWNPENDRTSNAIYSGKT